MSVSETYEQEHWRLKAENSQMRTAIEQFLACLDKENATVSLATAEKVFALREAATPTQETKS